MCSALRAAVSPVLKSSSKNLTVKAGLLISFGAFVVFLFAGDTTIFGSLFQSIMDANARHNLGVHYTCEENILKLIKTLFLDVLWAEFEKIKNNKKLLGDFHKKLRTLTFLTAACG